MPELATLTVGIQRVFDAATIGCLKSTMVPLPASIGRFWEIDEFGFIVNDANSNKVSKRLQSAIVTAIDAYRSHLGDVLHSVYLRGSVPRGLAIPGVSDLDTFGVTSGECDNASSSWSKTAEKAILRRYAELTGVQFELFSVSDVLKTDRVYELPFVVKTQSLCVFGSDLSAKLPDYRPDASSANIDICQIEADIDEARAQLFADEACQGEVDYWCSRIMKNIIRTGFSLTVPTEKYFVDREQY